ncbi:MAG: hypothetical protein KJ793_06055 [Candidatus Omnitrophica bacterium]|nr:hypothetical protein [Candidatus Omnitrophota bacterium]
MRSLRLLLLLAFSFQLSLRQAQGTSPKDTERSRSAVYSSFAQQDDRLVDLNKQKEIYFADNQYSEFIELLNSKRRKDKDIASYIDYYIALTRYHQLKYLEEEQLWDEYFNKGNDYRNDIVTKTDKVIKATTPQEDLRIYSELLSWQYHKDLADAFEEEALANLMSSVLEHSKKSSDILMIKEVADRFLLYGLKQEPKKLYKVYVDKIASTDIEDEELTKIAKGFYDEGNLGLAQAIYDVCIERSINSKTKDQAIDLLSEVARLFAYKDEGVKDTDYAEGVFRNLEQLGGEEAFDQELLYLRAYNLEKAKDYLKTKDNYIDLLMRYPKTAYKDRVLYKLGIIFTYALRDIKSGRVYFDQLAQREINFSPHVISGLYQLGILSQWERDSASAKEHYNKLLELAGEDLSETVVLTRQRLNEIDQGKPLEYNLKTFLNVSLKDEYSALDMSRVDLRASLYKISKAESVSVATTAYAMQSGCMQVDLEYLWSGNIGKSTPSSDQLSFDTSYADPGTKEINLVVVSATGIVERSLDLLDVQ